MCDIDKWNFEDHFDSIVEKVSQADFIVLDTEFTGLRSSQANAPSLFDNGEDRYKKLRRSTQQIAPSQIGISVFIQQKHPKTKYTAYTFNIYLFPQSFGPVDQRFICQASSLEFLTKHKFDFNRFIYSGVSYLNNDQEKEVKDHLKNNALLSGVDRDIDERELQNVCSKVAQWQVEAKEKETMEFVVPEGIEEYVIRIELKQRFHNIWLTTCQAAGGEITITVRKINDKERKLLEIEDKLQRSEHEKQFLDRLLGFTRVFRALIKSKKPLLGHNMLMDLMIWYDKFYRPLPESYKTYKADIHRLFPYIFDTKHISAKLRKKFLETGLLEETALGTLYKKLFAERTMKFLYNPTVEHGEGYDRYRSLDKPHEAGYDAYMTGCVFLQLCHMYSQMDVPDSEASKLAFRQYLPNVSDFANNVNIIRAGINHVNLAGADPPILRPEWLIFRSRRAQYKFNTSELAGILSQHGTVDVRLLGPRQALVAVGNKWCAKDILRAFTKHDHIRVCKYNVWKHSPIVRGLLWSGAAVSCAICLWAVLSPGKPK